MACSETQLKELSEKDLEKKLRRSYEILSNSGAHYVIDSVADLPRIIDDINIKLSEGQKP
ncbi:MAG: hypothetical protein GY696_32840 [Gammaproteobacteria bacterium]|nr:hypothetical protein [Gammaproteobacteria bacterium]